ncbi:hypothetical protein BCR35DRAFT_331388 [Leucosporidium creatinivorum]|uniref:RING-type domain-containing protein n=1 Tax=Leucosporidium creatinivorum TaxID=106004 RepID=A0A1Y2FFY6_9BASI|nr:hypothetical protein BCR35DRAFT_331388 [Leucosporidium creatinivorum]
MSGDLPNKLASLSLASKSDRGLGDHSRGRNPDRAISTSVHCLACADSLPLSAAVRFPCGHFYCRACLRSLLLVSIRGGSSFPPRCCDSNHAIPFSLVDPFLSAVERYRYTKKDSELGLGVMCSTIGCIARLGERAVKGTPLRCKKCEKETCLACRTPWHGFGVACKDDPADEAIAEKLFKLFKARRCPSCRWLVIREGVCALVRCRCGTMFCHDCGKKTPHPGGVCLR